MSKKLQHIRLAVVDDHQIFRDAIIKYILNKEKEFSVLLEAENGQNLIEKLNKDNLPDIAIVDVNMPRMNGFETVEWLKSNHPEIKILILTMYNDEDTISKMFKLGANGYLTKNVTSDELIIAIKSIVRKGFYYSDFITEKLVHLLQNENKSPKKKKESDLFLEVWRKLTTKEKEFIRFSCTDMTYAQIAHKLHLSPKAIEGYRISLFKKFNSKTRVGLAVKVTRNLLTLLKIE